MSELVIEYILEDQSARVSIDQDHRLFSKVRRSLEDVNSDLMRTHSQSVVVPWWVFLQARNSIVFHARRSGADIALNDAARSYLKVATSDEPAELAVSSAAELQKALTEKGFERILKSYQAENVLQLIKYKYSATFSVPGAGKTTEALALYALRRSADTKLLIVCPKSVFAVWEEQVNECLPKEKLKVVRLTGGAATINQKLNDGFDIGLITYQQLPFAKAQIANYIASNPTFLYLDESHKIKRGESGVIGQMLLDISPLASERLIMSGTPMPNSIADLVSQARFLLPYLPIDTENVISEISSRYVRTTKTQLELPPLNRKLIPIRMGDAQATLYSMLSSEFLRSARAELSLSDRASFRAIGKSAMRLIQAVTNPALLMSVPDSTGLIRDAIGEGDASKIQYAAFRARELSSSGKKVIIWSSFVKNVEMLASRLVDLGAEYIHGGVDAGDELEWDTREAKIKRFHDDPNCMVLVANPAACGEGISLHTICHNAIYVDRTYNVAHYLQSEDRIHRIGLKKDQATTVEILCCEGTVDESVNRRLVEKSNRMATVLNDSALNIEPELIDYDDVAGLDSNDIKDLIAIESEVSDP